MKPFEDPNHEGNSNKYHTGKLCVERHCNNPAGTAWSPRWCFECNVKRMRDISNQFELLIAKAKQS